MSCLDGWRNQAISRFERVIERNGAWLLKNSLTGKFAEKTLR
jgi:hypothetical protein